MGGGLRALHRQGYAQTGMSVLLRDGQDVRPPLTTSHQPLATHYVDNHCNNLDLRGRFVGGAG